ncbi:MAG: hypothetical protein A2007_05005 [Verrucomicrobia bacterium GWC2_42_7]|nr:MAG: hypothetical protein A2007_05005 [Verrucomicrobia bacterium GWC2_42_7]
MEMKRWELRFQNFERAFNLLNEVFDGEEKGRELSVLEKEGVIQRFEYTFELAWKTLKDFLEYKGIVLQDITPRTVIREAIGAKIIEEGQPWMDMLDHRNLMSHTYSEKNFIKAFEAIQNQYSCTLKTLYTLLKQQRGK